MRPLAALDDATCRTLRGIVFDIDDTVTRHGKLEREAFSALWDLRAAGLHAVAVTGRPLGWADVFARIWPVDLVVGENGAGWIASDGHATKTGYFLDDSAREYAQRILQITQDKIANLFPDIPVSGDHAARRCDLAFDIGETHAIPPARIEALCEAIHALGAKTTVSSVHAHAYVGEYDKAQGVCRAIRDILGHDVASEPARWLFVGDSGNDAPAFSFFPVSVGVANIDAHLHRLPRPPAYRSTHDRGLGFSELVTHVLHAISSDGANLR